MRPSSSVSASARVDGSACGVLTCTQTGATEYNVGYEHRFSKRTNVGIGYAKITNQDNAIVTWTGAPPNQGGASNNPFPGSDVSTFFLSMTHRF